MTEISRSRSGRQVSCALCGKRMSSKSFRLHMRTHTGERPYLCGVCGMGFSHANHLKRHNSNVHEKKLRCNCDWNTWFLSGVHRHVDLTSHSLIDRSHFKNLMINCMPLMCLLLSFVVCLFIIRLYWNPPQWSMWLVWPSYETKVGELLETIWWWCL